MHHGHHDECIDTYDEKEEGQTKYQFAIYSPSFEILKRIHALFTQVPEIVENMQVEKEAQRLRHHRMHQRLNIQEHDTKLKEMNMEEMD